jgi:hypothetical protein
MKLKNYYAFICIIWISSTFLNTLSTIIHFVDGTLWKGFIFLILSIAFAFVSGIYLEKAITIYKHNKTCDWLHDIAQELRQKEIEKIDPFEDIDKK